MEAEEKAIIREGCFSFPLKIIELEPGVCALWFSWEKSIKLRLRKAPRHLLKCCLLAAGQLGKPCLSGAACLPAFPPSSSLGSGNNVFFLLYTAQEELIVSL